MAGIDLHKLERELSSALEADKKYARENDAKFRAVNQRVASYEEFRDIVNASHLTPLDRQDIYGGKRSQPWNPLSRRLETVTSEGTGAVDWTDAPPTNAQEFIRQWRKFQGDSALQYQ